MLKNFCTDAQAGIALMTARLNMTNENKDKTMRYEKPIILNLGDSAKASGSCMAGTSPAGHERV